MPLIIPSNSISALGYEVDNSLRFDDDSSHSLTRTFGSGNQKTWTWSAWVKKTANLITLGNFDFVLFNGYQNNDNRLSLFYSQTQANGKVNDCLSLFGTASASTTVNVFTSALYRDNSAWYHVVCAFDTTQATGSNRIKIYVNGVQQTLTFSTTPAQDSNQSINFAQNHTIGNYNTNTASAEFDGYMAEVVFIDGTALDPTSFGEFDEDSGIWKPIDVSGLTFGTNGFYLDFENSGSLGADVSGNGNNFTVNNLTSIDQTTDSPTNNFSTMNPLDQNGGMTFSDGNLSVASTSAAWRSTRGTFGVTQGKWYYEVKPVNTSGSLLDMMVGWGDFSLAIPSEFSSSNPALTYTAGTGNKQLNGVNSAYGATYNVGDIIGVAFDADNLTVEYFKNGTSQGSISTGWSSGITWTPIIALYGRYNNTKASFNFGNPPFTISSGNSDDNGFGQFEYQPPSGYLALCTKNLATDG